MGTAAGSGGCTESSADRLALLSRSIKALGTADKANVSFHITKYRREFRQFRAFAFFANSMCAAWLVTETADECRLNPFEDEST